MSTSRTSSTKKRSAPWERSAPAKVARKRSTKLTSAQKAHAKTRARKAGRSYPNLVDNMHEASDAKKKSGGRKSTTRKKATGPSTAAKRKSTTKRKTTTTRASTARKSTARKSTTRRASKRTGTGTKKAAKRTGTKRAATKRAPRTGLKAATRDPHGGLTAAGRAELARKEGAHLKPGVTKREVEMSPDEMRRKGSWAVRFYGRKGALPPLEDAQRQPTRFALTAAAWGEPVPKTQRAARAIAAKGRRLLARAKSERARD
ncbi:MAG: DUF6321 domain-containing protein [Polyangiales bacterium]